ncbi:DUF4190 domain-containing protein [Microbacterium sp. 22242]|uniref:DUF4190 domain-containing protein n=1 Tax=Microbacterium sp. 22242 TaxID=3453896 RepID=UPI003F82EF52
MSNDQGGYPQNPGQQPPAYPGAPVPPQQQQPYPGAAPAPQAPVPPAPAYPGAAPQQTAPQQPHPPQAVPGGYPGAAPTAPGYAQPGAPAYAQPYAQPYATPKKSNGLALTSLICGIAGLVFFWIAYLILPILASVAAIITGHMALGRIKRDPQLGGKGMAIAGLVMGYVGVLLNLIIAALFFIGLAYAASLGGSGY